MITEKEIRKFKAQAYYQANREKLIAYALRWREDNREQFRAYQKEYKRRKRRAPLTAGNGHGAQGKLTANIISQQEG
jgi:hypothetical protein